MGLSFCSTPANSAPVPAARASSTACLPAPSFVRSSSRITFPNGSFAAALNPRLLGVGAACERQLERRPPGVHLAHVVHEVIRRLGREVFFGMKDEFRGVIEQRKARDRLLLPHQLQPQDVAVVRDGALEVGHAENDAVDFAKHAEWPAEP